MSEPAGLAEPAEPAGLAEPAEPAGLAEPAEPVAITPFEERPEVADAILGDTSVSGLPGTPGPDTEPDPDTPQFAAPPGEA